MCSAHSSGSLIGGTLTSGIQDIAALLPLLGTEQCEEHIGSALTNGFLYAAVTPMSLFGSLGVAKAGSKTFLASINIPWLKFDGAQILADAGFKPQGNNLSSIMIDEDQKSSLCAENRIQSMLKEFYIEDSGRITVSSKTWRWNLAMVLSTAVSCMIGITPYIHLNLGRSNLSHFVRWVFPAIRIIGGFLTATMIQFLIQNRLLEITRKQLILDGLDGAKLKDLDIDAGEGSDWARYPTLEQRFYLLRQKLMKRSDHSHAAPSSHYPTDDRNSGRMGSVRLRATRAASSSSHSSRDIKYVSRTSSTQITDPEKAVVELEPVHLESKAVAKKRRDLERQISEACVNSVLRWLYLVLLFVGILASVAGYIGCFSVVQGVESSVKALIWVCLEGGLSVLRMIIWSLNPKGDDAPPLEFKLKLDEHSPLPTCTSSAEYIEDVKVLPLVRGSEFLDTITSYTGLLRRFSNPTQALTLYYTLTRRCNTSSETAPEHRCGEHVLYITIFDYTERTTRVYGEDIKIDENATNSETFHFYSAEAVTVDVEHGVLRTKIGHRIHKDDPIAGNVTLRNALKDHYKSILNQVNYIPNRPKDDVLEDDWTLKFGEPQSEMQKKAVDPKYRGASTDVGEKFDCMRDYEYLEQGLLDRKVRGLIVARGKWIMAYMEWLYEGIDRMLGVQGAEIKGGERHGIEIFLIMEREQMEYMLVDEIYEWEKKLWGRFQDFVNKYGLDAGLRERLERVWGVSSLERLEEGRLAWAARMDAESGLQRVAHAGKEGAEEWKLKVVQRVCGGKIKRKWESFLAFDPADQRQTPGERLESRLEDLREKYWHWRTHMEKEDSHFQEWFQKMATRLRREVKGVEERLDRGIEACHEFRSDRLVVELMHSESKWLWYYPSWDSYDVMRRALTNNEYVKHIQLESSEDNPDDDISLFTMLRDKAACSSVCIYGSERKISDNIELSPNILSISGDRQLSEEHEATLNRNIAQLDEDQRTTFEFKDMSVDGRDLFGHVGCSFIVRFWGPSSGHLKLQLIHRSDDSKGHLAVELQARGEISCEQIPLSNLFAMKEIMIWNGSRPSSEPAELTFTRNVRNTLTFRVGAQDEINGKYYLRDIKLVDLLNEPYEPAGGHHGEGPSSHPLEDSYTHVEEASESG